MYEMRGLAICSEQEVHNTIANFDIYISLEDTSLVEPN